KRVFAEILFEIEASFDVDVEDYILTFVPDPINFGFQRSVEVPFVDFLPFDEFVVINLLLKLLGCKKVIILPILFGPSAFVACRCRNRETEIWICFKEVLDYCGFSGTGRS